LDVHPPHEPIRSWKDFTLHLLTITIGLLIALALEAAVQSLHHRHMVADARVNLLREIAENHTLYAENLRSLQTNLVRLEQDIGQLRDLRAGKTPEHFELQWSFGWDSYSDSAWKSARDSGALGYMRPEFIKKYSEVYGQQTFVNEAGVGILFDQGKAAAPLLIMKNRKDSKELSPGDIQALLLSAAELEGRVKQLLLFMEVLGDYTPRCSIYSTSLQRLIAWPSQHLTRRETRQSGPQLVATARSLTANRADGRVWWRPTSAIMRTQYQ
jgi:hypothetical protein